MIESWLFNIGLKETKKIQFKNDELPEFKDGYLHNYK